MKVKIPVVVALCESLLGRDKGNLYVVVEVLSSGNVLVADGKQKLLCNPKKKNLKHLRLANANASEYGADLLGGKVCDCQIAYAIKCYAQSK